MTPVVDICITISAAIPIQGLVFLITDFFKFFTNFLKSRMIIMGVAIMPVINREIIGRMKAHTRIVKEHASIKFPTELVRLRRLKILVNIHIKASA